MPMPKVRSAVLVLAAALCGAGSSVIEPPAALAAKKPYDDKRLGFRISIEDDYLQNPPKLTGDESYLVGDWYNDKAQFDSGSGLRPVFRILWFVDPKDPKPAAPAPAATGEMPTEKDFRQMFRDQMRVKSTEEYLDDWFQMNTHLFGEAVPAKDRFAAAETDKTASGKLTFQFFEVNAPSKKKPKPGMAQPSTYGFAAKLLIDRPKDRVEVGFVGACGLEYVKRFQKEFPAIVRSFTELKNATDTRNEGASAELSDDPEVMRKQIKDTKLIKGWSAVDTKNYLVMLHEDVDPKLARMVGEHIEAIRAQVYEKLFPPDRPIKAVSVVRVCKDQDQYMQYGGMGGSAGYWAAHERELVFYDNGKKDSLSVLYHEAFHQYIYYSVGEVSPHSWFNEGHGDFFAGHEYSGGSFSRKPFGWRISDAKTWKRLPNRPKLKDWIGWTQAQYYGRNTQNIDGSLNYAAGWSFVWFLRTTKKPEYQGILDRYFNSLKGGVTATRAAEEAFDKKMDDWRRKLDEWRKRHESDEEGADTSADPPPQMPERDRTSDFGDESRSLQTALETSFRGVDWDQLEKDWLAADY